MTIEQALVELQVEPGLPPTELRRAYLRAVKRHPPERDPEGFQRVREAFELLNDADALELTAIEAQAESPDPEAADLETPAESAGDRSSDEVDLDEPIELDELDELPDDAPRARVLEACRAIFTRRGDSAELTWQLVSWLEERGHHELVGELVSEAHQRGLREFHSPLLHCHPSHAQPEAIEQAIESTDPVLRNGALKALLVQGHTTEATKLAMELLHDAARDEEVTVYAELHVDLMIQLLASGARRAAAELEQAFRDFMSATGNESELLQGTTAARWLLFTEASSLHGVLPSSIYRALLDVLLGGDPQRAFKAIDHFAGYRQDAAHKAMLTLRARAPNLYDLIGSPRIERASAWSRYWPIGLFLILALRCTSTLSSWGTEEKAQRTEAAATARRPGSVPALDAADALGQARALQDFFKANGQRQLAELASTIQVDLERGDCTAAVADLRLLTDATQEADRSTNQALRGLILGVRASCVGAP